MYDEKLLQQTHVISPGTNFYQLKWYHKLWNRETFFLREPETHQMMLSKKCLFSSTYYSAFGSLKYNVCKHIDQQGELFQLFNVSIFTPLSTQTGKVLRWLYPIFQPALPQKSINSKLIYRYIFIKNRTLLFFKLITYKKVWGSS